MAANPTASSAEIAQIAKTTANYVYLVKYPMNKKAKAGKAKTAKPVVLVEQVEDKTPVSVVFDSTPAVDVINHPPHYKFGGVETIDFIEAKKLNYHLGNVVKYVTRADHKGERLENLKKARWYLDREIQHAENHA